ncbi:Type II secretion system protein F [Phycisphaerales bacterium]|nr:Type II secretion system protein F [Phycisphaerales bacterium]
MEGRMATYVYRTIAMGPQSRGATIEAPDRVTAVRELLRRGETPTTVEQVGRAGPGEEPAAAPASIDGVAIPSWTHRRHMTRAETASLIRELATALSAGLPLVPALRTLMKQGRNPAQRAMLMQVIEQVEAGRSLADSMAAWGKPFSELTINLTRAGEMSGRLAEVLSQAADLLDKDLKLRRSILGATLYPIILSVLVVGAIIVVVTFIVPTILEQIAGAAITLPWPTRVVQGVSDFLVGYWYVIVPGLIVAAVAARRYYQTPDGRVKVDMHLLRAPLLGPLLRDVAVARFTRTLGTLTNSGIPIVTALRITKGTLGNRAMENVIDDVVEQVSAGKTIAEPMEQSGYFPPMLVQIVNLGERSGRLDELLHQAAGAFEDRTEQSVKLFTTALPPVLVIFMALVIGFIVMAVLLALLEMQNGMMG